MKLLFLTFVSLIIGLTFAKAVQYPLEAPSYVLNIGTDEASARYDSDLFSGDIPCKLRSFITKMQTGDNEYVWNLFNTSIVDTYFNDDDNVFGGQYHTTIVDPEITALSMLFSASNDCSISEIELYYFNTIVELIQANLTVMSRNDYGFLGGEFYTGEITYDTTKAPFKFPYDDLKDLTIVYSVYNGAKFMGEGLSLPGCIGFLQAFNFCVNGSNSYASGVASSSHTLDYTPGDVFDFETFFYNLYEPTVVDRSVIPLTLAHRIVHFYDKPSIPNPKFYDNLESEVVVTEANYYYEDVKESLVGFQMATNYFIAVAGKESDASVPSNGGTVMQNIVAQAGFAGAGYNVGFTGYQEDHVLTKDTHILVQTYYEHEVGKAVLSDGTEMSVDSDACAFLIANIPNEPDSKKTIPDEFSNYYFRVYPSRTDQTFATFVPSSDGIDANVQHCQSLVNGDVVESCIDILPAWNTGIFILSLCLSLVIVFAWWYGANYKETWNEKYQRKIAENKANGIDDIVEDF
eukprot:gnl/Carplike_NY0171/468_a649_2924.p1 GENE.gnl/Carplike_NY0171/468_a649_2924~~gnl/Carplike_NY0171/468_a649_2924.p1  ORF type:complete len:518 (+),score=120.77 gnl/Carplike_NY0171/468_a649_2924:3-1556(+)